jgi:hypothetical protein
VVTVLAMVMLSALVTLMSIAAGMEVGSERLFEGTGQLAASSDIRLGAVHMGQQRYQVQLREVVIRRDKRGFCCLHFRRILWGEREWQGDLVRFVVVPKERLAREVGALTENPIPFLPPHLWLTTPPLRRVGQSWENKADGQVWWFFPSPLPTRYRVVAAETVNGRACWVVERTLPSQIGLMQLERYRERWWLAKAEGAAMRYTLDMAMRQPLPFGGSYSLKLQFDLRLQRERQLTEEALAKLRVVAERLASWQRRRVKAQTLPPDSEVALTAVEGLLGEWEAWRKEETDEWLVQCALKPWEFQMATMWQQLAKVRAQKGAPISAPDFVLKDTDGNTHRLSDLRGNFVVLSFFGFG